MLDAPLASDKVTRIVSARNSARTAPSAQSVGCNSLDSGTRRPKKAGNVLQKEKQHSGPYICKGWPMASQTHTPKRPRKIEEDRGKDEEDRGKDRGKPRKIEENRKRSRKTEKDRGKQKKIEEDREIGC